MPRRATLVAFGTPLLLAGCLGGAPGPARVADAPTAAMAEAAAPAAPPLPWPEAADCPALVAAVLAMPEANRARLRPEGSPLALAVADGPALLPAAEAAVAVEPDLPVRVLGDAGADAEAGARCLVLAGRPRVLPGGGRRLVGHEVVRSERRTGTRRVPYPGSALPGDEAGEEGDDDALGGARRVGRVLRTGDPGLDLIGLALSSALRGFDRLRQGSGSAGRPSGGAARRVDAPVFEPYSYEVSTFEVGRVAALDLALVDAAAGRAREVRHTLRERRTFPVAEGRHRADRGVLEGTGPQAGLPEDVAVFEGSPPRPALSGLLRVLLEAGGEGRPATTGDVLARLGAGRAPATPADDGGERRVEVETLEGTALGTWIDAERVAVPSSALGRSSLVQLTGPDGTRTFGMVERVDRERGAAVVRVGRRPGPAAGGLSDEALEATLRGLKPRAGR